MARKTPRGDITRAGEYYAQSRSKGGNNVRGLTTRDVANLIVIEDNTEKIVDAIGTELVRAMEAVGLVAEGYAKKLCPVDTGRLRNSITHTLDDDGKTAVIGTNVEYGPYVELGTKYHDAANDGRGFLRPAAEDHASKYRQIIESHLSNA